MRIEIYVAHKTEEKRDEVWAVRTQEKITYCRAVQMEGVVLATSFDSKRVPPAMIVIPNAHLTFEDGVARIVGPVTSNRDAVERASTGEN
jgi:hypothetical protein